MNKSELLEHLSQQVYCRLKPGTHGVGVFAIKDIPAGVDPFPGSYDGEYIEISDNELKEIPQGVVEMIKAYCVFEDGVWLVPETGLNSVDPSFFLNHSKDFNVKTVDGASFMTTRIIKEGEELLVDYDTYSEGLNHK